MKPVWKVPLDFNTEYYTGIYCYYNVALLSIIRYYDNGDAIRKTDDDGYKQTDEKALPGQCRFANLFVVCKIYGERRKRSLFLMRCYKIKV